MGQNKTKLIKDVNELLSFLSEMNVEYVSPEGKAYLDGLKLAEYKFEFVSKEKYDGLVKELREDCKNSSDANIKLTIQNAELIKDKEELQKYIGELKIKNSELEKEIEELKKRPLVVKRTWF